MLLEWTYNKVLSNISNNWYKQHNSHKPFSEHPLTSKLRCKQTHQINFLSFFVNKKMQELKMVPWDLQQQKLYSRIKEPSSFKFNSMQYPLPRLGQKRTTTKERHESGIWEDRYSKIHCSNTAKLAEARLKTVVKKDETKTISFRMFRSYKAKEFLWNLPLKAKVPAWTFHEMKMQLALDCLQVL